MKRIVNIALSVLVASLMMVAGMARMHHHSNERCEICFCIDDNHGCHDKTQSHDSDSEKSCPLHLDSYRLVEHDDSHHNLTIHNCDDHHCDICSPLIFSTFDFEEQQPVVFANQAIDTLCSGEHITLSRRGPPCLGKVS